MYGSDIDSICLGYNLATLVLGLTQKYQSHEGPKGSSNGSCLWNHINSLYMYHSYIAGTACVFVCISLVAS